jgi:hypothetical protein
VYAVNVVGDSWDYSDPAFNEIPPGGGWPTLTLDSKGTSGPQPVVIQAPTGLAASAVIKNKKTATVTLSWADNSNNETGFLVQRAYDANFTSGVVNATVAGDVTSLKQDVGRGTTFFYRVHAFNDTTQSGWSNSTTVKTP